MICEKCGSELAPGTLFCTACGTAQNQTTVLDETMAAAQFGASPAAAQAAAPQYSVYQTAPVPQSSAPALQLPTNRGLLKMILLGIITFGIYPIVVMTKIPSEINIVASRYDGRRTCPYFAAMYLTVLTYFVFYFVWMHNMSDRIGTELRRRGYDYKFGASTFWLWGVLGGLILVGPFVYTHKLMKAMNMINTSYNTYG